MKRYFFISLVMLLSCKAIQVEKSTTKFYVGTYTNGESQGIYQYEINNLGKFKNGDLQAVITNPSFLTKTADNKTLIAVSEVNENNTGFVYSYEINNDSLIYKSKSKSGGAHPCFITVNEKNQVLVANYLGGNVGYLKVDNINGLTNLLSVQQHEGNGTTDRQKAPHAHSTWFNPYNEHIISVDLGTNELWFSTIDENNQLNFSNQKKLKLADGAGPRHLVFHPTKKWIYVLNELNNTITLVTFEDGIYTLRSTISMLPENYTKYSKGADIHISRDGKFVYASNRGHNSIVIYKVDEKNGALKLVDFTFTKGNNPRNFSLTPDNRFLVVANQDTNTLVSFLRNEKTGKLSYIDEVQAPNPVCVLF